MRQLISPPRLAFGAWLTLVVLTTSGCIAIAVGDFVSEKHTYKPDPFNPASAENARLERMFDAWGERWFRGAPPYVLNSGKPAGANDRSVDWNDEIILDPDRAPDDHEGLDSAEYFLLQDTAQYWRDRVFVWRQSLREGGANSAANAAGQPPLVIRALERVRDAREAQCSKGFEFRQLAENLKANYPTVTFIVACGQIANQPPEAAAQTQMHRIMQGREALHDVYRLTRDAPLSPEILAHWQKGLKIAFVCGNEGLKLFCLPDRG